MIPLLHRIGTVGTGERARVVGLPVTLRLRRSGCPCLFPSCLFPSPTGSQAERLSPQCGGEMFQTRGVAGYLYILSNPSMPGLLKIGLTTRPVLDRVEELNAATGVPTAFKIEAYFESSNPQAHEAFVRWE